MPRYYCKHCCDIMAQFEDEEQGMDHVVEDHGEMVEEFRRKGISRNMAVDQVYESLIEEMGGMHPDECECGECPGLLSKRRTLHRVKRKPTT